MALVFYVISSRTLEKNLTFFSNGWKNPTDFLSVGGHYFKPFLVAACPRWGIPTKITFVVDPAGSVPEGTTTKPIFIIVGAARGTEDFPLSFSFCPVFQNVCVSLASTNLPNTGAPTNSRCFLSKRFKAVKLTRVLLANGKVYARFASLTK